MRDDVNEIQIDEDELTAACPASQRTDYGSLIAPVAGIGVSDQDDADDSPST